MQDNKTTNKSVKSVVALCNDHLKKKNVKVTCKENSWRPLFGVIHVVYFYCKLTLVSQAHGLWTNAQYDEDTSVWTVFMHDNALTVFHALLAKQPARKIACSGNKRLFEVCTERFFCVKPL